MYIYQERPYHVDRTTSRPLCEVKRRRARLVLRWGTTWEALVLFLFFAPSSVIKIWICSVRFFDVQLVEAWIFIFTERTLPSGRNREHGWEGRRRIFCLYLTYVVKSVVADYFFFFLCFRAEQIHIIFLSFLFFGPCGRVV